MLTSFATTKGQRRQNWNILRPATRSSLVIPMLAERPIYIREDQQMGTYICYKQRQYPGAVNDNPLYLSLTYEADYLALSTAVQGASWTGDRIAW